MPYRYSQIGEDKKCVYYTCATYIYHTLLLKLQVAKTESIKPFCVITDQCVITIQCVSFTYFLSQDEA